MRYFREISVPGSQLPERKNRFGDDIYHGRICKSVGVMEHDERNGMSAERAGAYITKIANKYTVKPYYVFRVRYKAAIMLSRLLPVRLAVDLVGKIYG